MEMYEKNSKNLTKNKQNFQNNSTKRAENG